MKISRYTEQITQTMNRTGIIEYPLFIDEVSAYVGKLRDLYNYNMNESNDRYKRGDRSEYVNILGVKGELIFSYLLFKNDIKHVTNTLLSNKPISSFDIKIGNNNIDIKTIRTDAPDILVNKEAHDKCKNINTYVFIRVLGDGKAQYWVYDYTEVSNWDVKEVGYSDAYYMPIYLIKKQQ